MNRLLGSSGTTATNAIDTKVMFPSIHDAVLSAVQSRDFAVCLRYFTLDYFFSRILPEICLSLTRNYVIRLFPCRFGKK